MEPDNEFNATLLAQAVRAGRRTIGSNAEEIIQANGPLFAAAIVAGAPTFRRNVTRSSTTVNVSTPENGTTVQVNFCPICAQELAPSEILIHPCPSRGCDFSYCHECVGKMFRLAISDRGEMPPRCCHSIIPLHVASDILTVEEMATYRDRFDEIVTTDGGFYCARKTCSAWISGARVDEAAAANMTVACNKCHGRMCTKCRGEEHVAKQCSKGDGNDDETKLLQTLEKWGYKQCPKCRNAVRKMFGCSHIQ
jgi:hypothetical protein